MSVKIGHAVQDEHGGSTGAMPGDQTGEEIRIQNWYNRSGGWTYYLECTDATLAERAAKLMEQICNSPAFGYSKTTRWTGYNAIKANGGKVDGAADSNFDCSSLCIACYVLAGLNHKASGYTGSMKSTLLATGKFKAYTDAEHVTSCDYAKRGGLYLAPGKHVAMVLSDGPKAEKSEADEIDPPYVETLGRVYIRTGPGTSSSRLAVAAKGSKFPYYETDADTGWYWIGTRYGDACITGNPKYTRLVTDNE